MEHIIREAAPSHELGEFRAEIARRQLLIYRLAVDAQVHPARLGAMLGGKIPMPPEVAHRLRAALELHGP